MLFPTPAELATQTLIYRKPTDQELCRHGRADELLRDLFDGLLSLRAGDYAKAGEICLHFAAKLGNATHPDTDFPAVEMGAAYPEGTEIVRVLSRVRMCATRALGAPSPTGAPSDWREELAGALRTLDLAVHTAITVR